MVRLPNEVFFKFYILNFQIKLTHFKDFKADAEFLNELKKDIKSIKFKFKNLQNDSRVTKLVLIFTIYIDNFF
jgi:hypothetical protein